MKTDDSVALLERNDYDNMSFDELRYLKDHCRLPAEVEAQHFAADRTGGGRALDLTDVEYTGDEGTRFAGIPESLRGQDLSLIDVVAERDDEIERLRRLLDQAEAQRDQALQEANASDEEDDEEDDEEEVAYGDMSLNQLHDEIDLRNEERAEAGGDLQPLTKPGTKAKSIAELERDDTERPQGEG